MRRARGFQEVPGRSPIGFRVLGLGLWVWESGFRVLGLGCRVLSLGIWG